MKSGSLHRKLGRAAETKPMGAAARYGAQLGRNANRHNERGIRRHRRGFRKG